ncbi:MAG: KH domain-containing protein [Candidatus Nanoarchaeia archaeon]
MKLICDKIARIIKARKKLEQKLGVKITNRGKELTITGNPENEYIAEKVIDALNFGFPFSTALQIKEEENFMFEILNIKDYTKRRDLERIRARIIGKKGKTLSTLSQLTKCAFELKNNQVGIIGPVEYIENAQEAIISIIQGSKQSNVYAHLEKHPPKPAIDLGLKK